MAFEFNSATQVSILILIMALRILANNSPHLLSQNVTPAPEPMTQTS
jgi:hypothetical protein